MSQFRLATSTFFALLVDDVLNMITLFERAYKIGPTARDMQYFDVDEIDRIVPFKRFYICKDTNPYIIVIRASDTLREYKYIVFEDKVLSVQHRGIHGQQFAVFLDNVKRDVFFCTEDGISEHVLTPWTHMHETHSSIVTQPTGYNVLFQASFVLSVYCDRMELYKDAKLIRTFIHKIAEPINQVQLDMNGTIVRWNPSKPCIEIWRFGDENFTQFVSMIGKYQTMTLDQHGALVLCSRTKICKINTFY